VAHLEAEDSAHAHGCLASSIEVATDVLGVRPGQDCAGEFLGNTALSCSGIDAKERQIVATLLRVMLLEL
jgi:hypothetical protein